jgi:hypothetical protein
MIPESNIAKQELDMEVIVSQDDAAVYVKLTGFEDLETAETYASFLVDHLPLMLFESTVLH